MSQPQLDPLQLALLQQLANKANLGSVPSVQPVPLPVSLVPQQLLPSIGGQNAYAAGPSQSPPHHREQHPNSDHRDPRLNRYDETSDRGRGRDDFYEDRRDLRGSPRGGYRGRGRDEFRGRFGDRDRFRDRGDDWGPPSRRRSRSRSRSPPRSKFSGRRDVKPYSPPQRPSVTSSAAMEQEPRASHSRPTPGASAAGKDEFGRDIRPESPEADAPPSSNDKSDVHNVQGTVDAVHLPSTAAPTQPLSPVAVKSPKHERETSTVAPTPAGLDKFDFSTFDFTNPLSWSALGDAFKVTNGYIPSQEALLQLVSGGMAALTAVGGNQPMVVDQPGQWSEQSWGGATSHSEPRAGAGYRGGRGRGRGRSARGGRGYGDGGAEQGVWGGYSANAYGQESEAIVLAGDTAPDDAGANGAYSEAHEGSEQPALAMEGVEQTFGGGGGAGGQMRKVGDRWVFVRDGATEVA